MNCKQAEELLPLYAGHELEEKHATLVTDHLQTCAACARVADEYRESVQLMEQFAPPVFSEAVYAGIRQRVMREIEAEATEPAWSQTIVSLFRPRLTWAIAGVLLVVVSMLAIYFTINTGNDEQQLTHKTPTKIQPGAEESSDSGPQAGNRVDLPPSVNKGGKKQQLAGVLQPPRKRSRNTRADRINTDSAALVKTLRVEIQTKDPKIRIIWFVQQETKPKGT